MSEDTQGSGEKTSNLDRYAPYDYEIMQSKLRNAPIMSDGHEAPDGGPHMNDVRYQTKVFAYLKHPRYTDKPKYNSAFPNANPIRYINI